MSKIRLNELESYILKRFFEADYQWLDLTDEINFLGVGPTSSNMGSDGLHELERALGALVKLGLVRLYETTTVKNTMLGREELLDFPLEIELQYDLRGQLYISLDNLISWNQKLKKWQLDLVNSNVSKLSIVLTDHGHKFVYQ